jgi:hypothetical protein
MVARGLQRPLPKSLTAHASTGARRLVGQQGLQMAHTRVHAGRDAVSLLLLDESTQGADTAEAALQALLWHSVGTRACLMRSAAILASARIALGGAYARLIRTHLRVSATVSDDW